MSDQPADIDEIYLAAVALSGDAERAAFLDQACAARPELRQRIERLLRAQPHVQGFLESVAAPPLDLGPLAPTLLETVRTDVPGTKIGVYTLLEQIGEGGMGVVYVAEQTVPVRRRVALKIVKPGMDTREVLSRFEAERQALAMMNHPHIAKILDGGMTDSGRPYFVMELVKGIPITDYCDQHKLSLRQRLELFILVCQAVQHAHQRGIIHRDLKPSNVLVELHDVVPVPKIIDFGISKAINQQLSSQPIYTQFAQLVGTPLYMSPEQAQLSGLDVDTRSDVYSLGVLLYELLSGATPFDSASLMKSGLEEMRRIIREDEPARPSSKVSTMHAERLSTVSDRRQTDARKLSATIQRELDWIVMKTLEKDRNRRYESASALAADVQRYLVDEPVLACPASAAYRLRKYVRKHRTLLTTVVIVTMALLLGTVASTWQAFEAISANKLADERLILADERLELANKRLVSEQQALAQANEQRQRASENLQKALGAVDQMLIRVAENKLEEIPGAEHLQRELFQDALKFYDQFLKQAPDDFQLRVSTAKAWSRISHLHHTLGNVTKGQETLQESIRLWEALHAERPDDSKTQDSLAQAFLDFGIVEHWSRHQFPSAEKAFKRAIALWQDLAERFPDQVEYAWNAVKCELPLADNYKCTARPELAEQTFRHALDVQRKLANRESAPATRVNHLCEMLCTFAVFLGAQRRFDEAEIVTAEALRRAEENRFKDPESLKILSRAAQQYGDALSGRGKHAEAEQHFQQAVEAARQVPRISPLKDIAWMNPLPSAALRLADHLILDGRYTEALKLYRAAGDFLRPGMIIGPDRMPASELSRADLGVVNCLEQLSKQGHGDEARQICEELSQVTGSDAAAMSSRLLAMMAWEAVGEVEKSNALLKQVTLECQKADQSQQKLFANAMFQIGDTEFHRANYDRAFHFLDLAILLDPANTEALDHRGQIFLARGEIEKALADLDAAVALGPKYPDSSYAQRAKSHFRLGHYTPALADLLQFTRLDLCLDPAEVAACPDVNFRKSYLAWFKGAFAASKPTSEIHLQRAALIVAMQEGDVDDADRTTIRMDLDAILADNAPAHHTLYRAGIVALLANDAARYQQICQKMLAAFAETKNPDEAGFAAWTCALTPKALGDYEPAITLARRAVALKNGDRRNLTYLAAILSRAGQFDEALTQFVLAEGAPPTATIPPAYTSYYRAMTHHWLGDTETAQRWLDQADTEHRAALSAATPPPWFQRQVLNRLGDEARQLIQP